MEHSTIISALTTGHKKSAMHLIAFSCEAASEWKPQSSNKYASRISVYALPKLDDKDTHTEYLITYYLCALLFPISFRGFWLNAK